MKLCECGCGSQVKYRFVRGHNVRVNNPVKNKEVRDKISASGKIAQNRPEVKAKLSASHLIAMNRPEVKAKSSASNLIAQNRPEVKAKKSAAISGENNYQWQGGLTRYYHEKARELFGSPLCQRCGISLEEYLKTHKRQFDMHCVSGERKEDYSILEQWNWRCVCRKCHEEIHKELRRLLKNEESKSIQESS